MYKICFITTVYDTYHYFLKSFSTFLHQHGEFEVHLICDDGRVIPGDIPEYVHYHPVSMERGISIKTSMKAIIAIHGILKRERFNMVQYSTPNASFYSSIAAKAVRIPVRLYAQWGIRYMGFQGFVRKFFRLIEKLTCSFSTFIEVESHGVHYFGVEEGLYSEQKSTVVWNGSACGIDIVKYNINMREEWRNEIRQHYSFHPDDCVFCFIGRLTADKGVNELFEAFLKMNGEHDRLLILGEMEDEESLRKDLLDKVRYDSHVFFAGQVKEAERFYAASDVFVSPSYREGFGLVAIEAQAMGIPAIVTDVPGQKDAIEPGVTGILCKARDSESLRKVMTEIRDHPELRIKMGDKAKQMVRERFDQQVLFHKLLENRLRLLQGKNKNQ